MKRTIPFLITLIKQGSLVKQIIAGLVLGILVALAFPGFAQGCGVLGSFFVSALKAVAPVLVFVLVAASIANQERRYRSLFGRYIPGSLSGCICKFPVPDADRTH